MRTRILMMCGAALVGCLVAPGVRADEGDETLRYYLGCSDLVLDATVVELGGPVFREAGVANYGPKLEIHAVLQGRLPESGAPLRVGIVRFEANDEDRLPYLGNGSRVVLFLRKVGREAEPFYRTANLWFGVQPYTPELARRLRALRAERRGPRQMMTCVATAPSGRPEAMDTVFSLLQGVGIFAYGVGEGGWDKACVPSHEARRARLVLREALASPAAAKARDEADSAGVEAPAAWDFRVREEEATDPAPALPDGSDSRAWWQSRLDLLREGMTFEEVRRLLPPWGGTEAAQGGGGVEHRAWTVSPHWMVLVDFSDGGACVGGGRLVALDLPKEQGRPERIGRLVLRRAYEVPPGALEPEGGSLDRDTAFHVEEEIEVFADGRYRWTQVSHTEEPDIVREGMLPEALTAGLTAELGVGSTPVRIDETEAGPKGKLPPGVAAVLAHLRGEGAGRKTR